MNNSSWVPPQQQNQLNLEQEYVYDSSTEYNQDMGYQANWRGGCGPQHFPASFHPNQTQSSHTAYLGPGDASSQQINDEGRQFQQLQPRFSMSSQNAVDGGIRTSSNEGYGPSSLNRIQVDYGLRYASPHSSSPSGPASAYPNSPTSQLGQYPGRGVVGGVRAPNPYPRDTPTSLQNQSTNDKLVHFPCVFRSLIFRYQLAMLVLLGLLKPNNHIVFHNSNPKLISNHPLDPSHCSHNGYFLTKRQTFNQALIREPLQLRGKERTTILSAVIMTALEILTWEFQERTLTGLNCTHLIILLPTQKLRPMHYLKRGLCSMQESQGMLQVFWRSSTFFNFILSFKG